MPWVKGQSGNPNGRPKGVRERLTRKLLCDLERDWREHGEATIERARKVDPMGYVRMMASLLPKEEQRRGLMHSIEVTLRQPSWLEDKRQILDISPETTSDIKEIA